MIQIQTTLIPHTARSKYYKNVVKNYTSTVTSSYSTSSSSTTSDTTLSFKNIDSTTTIVSGYTQIDIMSSNYLYIIDNTITQCDIVLNNTVSKLVVVYIRNNTSNTITLRNKFKIENNGNVYDPNMLNIMLYKGSTLILNIKPDSDIIYSNMLHSIIDGGTF